MWCFWCCFLDSEKMTFLDFLYMCFTVLGTFAQHLDITNQYLVTSLVTGLKRNPVGYIWFVTRACTPLVLLSWNAEKICIPLVNDCYLNKSNALSLQNMDGSSLNSFEETSSHWTPIIRKVLVKLITIPSYHCETMS